MKPLFSAIAALALAAFASCSGSDDIRPSADERFTMTATPLPGSEFEAFVDHDARFHLSDAGDGTQTLRMERVKFVSEMPRLTIEVRGITLDDGSFAADAATPYYNGAEMPRFQLSDFGISVSPLGQMTVTFDCYTMHVVYTGPAAGEK